MLPRRPITRFDERHRLQIVAAADFRFSVFFESAEELGHRAGEGVGEPDFVPSGLNPFTGIAGSRVVERARGGLGIFGPPNSSAAHPLGSFDTPTDADVFRG